MVQRIDIIKLNKINELENYWAGFYDSLMLFAQISGQLLREGEGRVMGVYNHCLSLYNKGLDCIRELRDSVDEEKSAEIIKVSHILINQAEEMKKSELKVI